MTWVFGSPTWLGTSVCLADIQVTVGEKTFDCLRKVYGLDRNLMAGFAGNVKTGFGMLARLQRLSNDMKQSAYDPTDVQGIFDHYPAAAAELFASLGDDGLEGGSAILVAAAEPADNTVYGSKSRAARFVWPDFATDEIPHKAWASIGSGSDIPAYQAELDAVTGDDGRPLVVLEANNRGGHARAMAFFVTQAVGDMPPVEGISKHFHVGVVFADGWELGTSDRTQFRGGPPEEIRMPHVAESWDELERQLTPHLAETLTVAIAA
jgi:hypothetical protein